MIRKELALCRNIVACVVILNSSLGVFGLASASVERIQAVVMVSRQLACLVMSDNFWRSSSFCNAATLDILFQQ